MSSLAAVQVEDLFDEDKPKPPGSYQFSASEDYLLFVCPCGCGSTACLSLDRAKQTPAWTWDGNRDQPTLHPSIRQMKCGWHGWLRAGQWVTA